MTIHAPTLNVAQDQPPLPNQPFSPWLRGQTTLFISQISAIFGFVLFLASLIYYLSHLGEPSRFLQPAIVKLVVDYAHVVFMAVFILVLIQVLDDNERGSYRVKLVHERVFGKYDGDYKRELEESKDQLKKFKRRFLWFWIGMLFLYVFFTCQHSYELISKPAEQSIDRMDLSFSRVNKGSDGKEAHFQADFSYETKDKTETSNSTEEANQGRKQLNSPAEIWKKLAFPFIVFFFNNVTLLFIYWCFVVLHVPSSEMAKRYRKYRNWSLLVVGGLTLLFPLLAYVKGVGHTVNEWNDFSAVLDALSGVINALVLALLIARLDSKLIGLPSWLISILYSYSAVQPLFMVFELNEAKVLDRIATSVLIFVFVSKIYFFLIIIYALQTGKMLNYLFCFPILRDRVKRDGASILSVSNSVTTQSHSSSNSAEAPNRKKDTPVPNRLMRFLDACDKYAWEHVSRRGKLYIARPRLWLSRWLRTDYALRVSRWLGLTSISYFFISLVVFLLIPNDGHGYWDVAGLRGAATHLKDAYLHLLFPKSASIEWKSILSVVIDSAQLLFVFGIVVTIYLIRNKNQYGRDKAFKTAHGIFEENLKPKYPPEEGEMQLRKFKEYFLYFWCVIFLLYIVFLFDHLKIGFGLVAQGQVAPSGSLALMARVLFYPFFEFVLSTLNLMFIFWCFVILRAPAFDKRAVSRQKQLINSSSFVIALLIALFPLLLFILGAPNLSEDNLRGYATVFDGVTGTLSAVVLALLIARMDSKLFGLPFWSIGMLFAYASIQPLFVAFALNARVLNVVQTSVLTTALGLKICFFLIIARGLQNGSVLNYLICFPFLRNRVDSIFENQFEIKLAGEEQEFTFSILKKTELRYSTAIRFETRKESDAFIHYLREQMQKREAYLPSKEKDLQSPSLEESGTYWVEVRSDPPQRKLLCESIPLRSEDEAYDLITESMDKIPYCKYNRA